eukprot:4927889-Alexandrium_andersonii.AAC.1
MAYGSAFKLLTYNINSTMQLQIVEHLSEHNIEIAALQGLDLQRPRNTRLEATTLRRLAAGRKQSTLESHS